VHARCGLVARPWPLSFTVMRPFSVLPLLLLGRAIAEVPPIVLPQCGIGNSAEQWVHLAKPPAQANAMLNISISNGTVRSVLGLKPPGQTEAWFRSKTGKVRYCRYYPDVDVCAVSPTWVDFLRHHETWTVEGPMAISCVSSR
jgi:hypothetical protein